MTAPEPTPTAEHIDAAREPASVVGEFIDDELTEWAKALTPAEDANGAQNGGTR